MSLDLALMFLPGFLIGLTVHEGAHALSAKWLGDSTSEKMGRISLNPFKHLSPMGTAALFFLGFGWGRPVQVNLYNFEKPKFYYLLSSLAGPVSNMLLCGISLGLIYLTSFVYGLMENDSYVMTKLLNILTGVYLINAVLAVINLVPIPPLDGSKIWPCIIPGMRPISSSNWNNLWIVVVVIFITDAMYIVLKPVLDLLMTFLPGGN